MAFSEYPYSRTFDVTRLSGEPVSLVLELNDEQRSQMAEAYDLIGIEALTVELTVRPWRRNGAAVRGSLSANVTQRCVVTLEPVEGQVSDEFDRSFLPAQDHGKRKRADDELLEIDLEVDETDPPDEFEGTSIDLGHIVCEQFALALNPFPRAAGVEMDQQYAPDESIEDEPEEKESPFAALAALKKDENSGS